MLIVNPCQDGRRTGKSSDGVEVGGLALAEDKGGGDVVSGRVGDGVGLTSNNTRGGEAVDLEGSDGSSEGREGDGEEAHVEGFGVCWCGLGY